MQTLSGMQIGNLMYTLKLKYAESNFNIQLDMLEEEKKNEKVKNYYF